MPSVFEYLLADSRATGQKFLYKKILIFGPSKAAIIMALDKPVVNPVFIHISPGLSPLFAFDNQIKNHQNTRMNSFGQKVKVQVTP